ncbi:hypothetical protein HK414_23010 [Ramlibacter terrae]|uniref:VCBS repeat-containing protein n=1 Tax=Ramlibacter terrae TaxID=2732511 RepID=A0ABX6P7A9_9BURK|nr:hypothetical protein HK414_23010 [Ramlibacter terrae]
MKATTPTTLRALRDLAAVAAAGLAAASIWAAGLPDDVGAGVAPFEPQVGVDYALALGDTRISLRVENVVKGMEYAIAYGGHTYTYVLGPFDATHTAVREVADFDGDALPDFVVDVDEATYLLLSTHAAPGANRPAVEFAGHDGC